MFFRRANAKDLPLITDIYNQAIRTHRINYEPRELSTEERKEWFRSHQDERFGVWVAVNDDDYVVGYASLNHVYNSPYADNSATTSCYLDMNNTGNGIGTKLMRFLIQQAKNNDFKYLLGDSFTINTPSNQMVKDLGFIKYGETPEIIELPDGKKTSISQYALKLD